MSANIARDERRRIPKLTLSLMALFGGFSLMLTGIPGLQVIGVVFIMSTMLWPLLSLAPNTQTLTAHTSPLTDSEPLQDVLETAPVAAEPVPVTIHQRLESAIQEVQQGRVTSLEQWKKEQASSSEANSR